MLPIHKLGTILLYRAECNRKVGDMIHKRISIELLINPFCLCERDFVRLSKICEKHQVAFETYNLWDIDDENVDELPDYMSLLIKEWRNGQRDGAVYSSVFIDGERIPINQWPISFDIIEDKITTILGKGSND